MTSAPVSPMSLDVADPEEIGIDPRRLDILLRLAGLPVEYGPLPSAQLAVARNGRLAASRSWGAASPRYLLQSVGRSVVAGAIWKLIGEGRIDVSATVASVIPEFGANGKQDVTIEHVLAHTAGFPFAPLGYPKMADRELRLAAFAKWRLDWEPGSRLQWHLTSAAWLLAELVERVGGKPLPEYLRTEIAEPLGLDLALGVAPEEQKETVAPMVCTDGDGSEVDPWGPWYLNNPDIVAAGEPAHSVVSSAASLALYYQALLHSPLWAPGTVRDAVRARVTAVPAGDPQYGGGTTPTGVGLFVVVAGEGPGLGMPSVGSAETFGNSGAPCQMGFCDPVSGISFAWLTNGYPTSGYDRGPRTRALMTNLANLAADLAADA